ncbi:MAG: hypothetical protein ABI882_10455 [Acidobacteriota bacterium]
MKLRLLIAGLLAGVVVFFWGFFSHSVLGLGESSMKSIPNEPAVISALSSNIAESGFYFFPGAGLGADRLPKEQQEAAMQKWDADYKTLPHGILIVKKPTGAALPFTKLLLIELGTTVLGGLLAAWLLSLAAPSLPSFIGRVFFVAVLGFFASVNIDASYWNWYDFPTGYLTSSLIDSTVGWALAGVVLAFMIRPRS